MSEANVGASKGINTGSARAAGSGCERSRIIDAILRNEKKFSAMMQAMQVERGPACRAGIGPHSNSALLCAVETEKCSFATTAVGRDFWLCGSRNDGDRPRLCPIGTEFVQNAA